MQWIENEFIKISWHFQSKKILLEAEELFTITPMWLASSFLIKNWIFYKLVIISDHKIDFNTYFISFLLLHDWYSISPTCSIFMLCPVEGNQKKKIIKKLPFNPQKVTTFYDEELCVCVIKSPIKNASSSSWKWNHFEI